MINTKVPAWLKGCKLAQYCEKDDTRYVTYVLIGRLYIPISFSDTKDGWQHHARWAGKSFADMATRNGLTCFNKESITKYLNKKFVRSWVV